MKRITKMFYNMATLGLVVLPNGCTAAAPLDVRYSAQSLAGAKVGAEIQLCDDCPIFVRVPDPPGNLRAIRFVSKYELTWKNYLISYDKGACPIPAHTSRRGHKIQKSISKHLDKMRIDWPANWLTQENIECYVGWLNRQSSLKVTLPDPNEWEWFARAGQKGVKYPWGNNASSDKEALRETEIPFELERPYRVSTFDKVGSDLFGVIYGVKVGQFPANPWGLHDLMGNVMELTSDVLTPDSSYKSKSKIFSVRHSDDVDHVSAILKGSDRSLSDWQKGISEQRQTAIFEGTYYTHVSLRLILVEDK